jgi:hypothetical protein
MTITPKSSIWKGYCTFSHSYNISHYKFSVTVSVGQLNKIFKLGIPKSGNPGNPIEGIGIVGIVKLGKPGMVNEGNSKFRVGKLGSGISGIPGKPNDGIVIEGIVIVGNPGIVRLGSSKFKDGRLGIVNEGRLKSNDGIGIVGIEKLGSVGKQLIILPLPSL